MKGFAIGIAATSLLFFATVAASQRLTTFAWNADPDWPAGTTVELCGNGPTCVDGITGTQGTLLLPVVPGAVIEGRARAVPPAGYLCGDPPALCPQSAWATVAQTWPMPAQNVVASYVPVLWESSDVGTTLSGSVAIDGGEFTVVGNGADIWGTEDAFHFVHQPLTGDGSITARVASLTNTSEWAKAGVMIRESLGAGSRHVLVTLTSSNGVRFIRRTSTGGTSLSTVGAAVAAPYWVRLIRSGRNFTAYQSADGSTWTQVGSAVIINMNSNALVGLAVSSHNSTVTTTAVFTHVSISLL